MEKTSLLESFKVGYNFTKYALKSTKDSLNPEANNSSEEKFQKYSVEAESIEKSGSKLQNLALNFGKFCRPGRLISSTIYTIYRAEGQ